MPCKGDEENCFFSFVIQMTQIVWGDGGEEIPPRARTWVFFSAIYGEGVNVVPSIL